MYNTQSIHKRYLSSRKALTAVHDFSEHVNERAFILISWLEEHKSQKITAYDVTAINSCMDVVIVVTATSSRHGQGLADGILEQCTKYKYEYLRMEGYHHGQWILVDLNDIVINIFQAATRELYAIETLWKKSQLLYQQT